jgi:hypothetical protein
VWTIQNQARASVGNVRCHNVERRDPSKGTSRQAAHVEMMIPTVHARQQVVFQRPIRVTTAATTRYQKRVRLLPKAKTRQRLSNSFFQLLICKGAGKVPLYLCRRRRRRRRRRLRTIKS